MCVYVCVFGGCFFHLFIFKANLAEEQQDTLEM